MVKSSGVLTKAVRRTGLAQYELARKMGTSEAAISKWLKGTRRPTPENARKLAKLLGLTLDEIYG